MNQKNFLSQMLLFIKVYNSLKRVIKKKKIKFIFYKFNKKKKKAR